MSTRAKAAVIAAAVILGFAQVGAFASLAEASEVPGTVLRIVDGDTLVVRADGTDRKVRLLNIDAPETVAPNEPVGCLGPEASAKLAELLPVGAKVTLLYDAQRKDKYGRDLAGVKTSAGTFAHVEMVRLGLALPHPDSSNRKFAQLVQAASTEAADNKVGLYSPTQDCTLASEVAKVEEQAQALGRIATPTTAEEVADADGKAVALSIAAAALTERILKKDSYEVRALPSTTVANYQQRADRVHSQVKSSRADYDKITASLAKAKAEAEAKAKAEAEAAEKAAAEAAAKAKAEADAAAAAEAARRAAPPAPAPAAPAPFVGGGGGAAYYKNCTAARAAGVTPIYRGQPGYGSHLDRDNDGIACE